ncbi:MAG: MATE family efflux transporter [Lachnospiraceae bacterium]
MGKLQAILALAIPIIIQNLFQCRRSSADVIMLNSVGQSAVSASSLAVQYTNVLYMIFYGLGTGSTMLCARYWGKERPSGHCAKVEGNRPSLCSGLFHSLCGTCGGYTGDHDEAFY